MCDDIAAVLDRMDTGDEEIPDFDLLVGGFPCQDYSVAKVLSQSAGLSGKKGVLWWQIYKLLKARRPPYLILENVDRLLKSPAAQRGRDFAVMLWCLNDLGYQVEWRVVNASDYGFPQRRRRVFIVGYRLDDVVGFDGPGFLYRDGVLARAFPVNDGVAAPSFTLTGVVPSSVGADVDEVVALSDSFGLGVKKSPFLTGGVIHDGKVWTDAVEPRREPMTPLRSILLDLSEVNPSFFLPPEQLPRWRYLKGAKKEERRGRDGFVYYYNEGPVEFPEPLDQPSRTVLTGEGGASPSRFKHVVEQEGTFRRLMPVELERLQGFPDGWTDTGMPDARRAFMMGNALVVGLVRRIGQELGKH